MILTWLCYAVGLLLALSAIATLGAIAKCMAEIAAILTEIRDELRKIQERRA